METIAKTSKLNQLFKKAEFNRFGINSAVLIITGCLGGVAVGLGAINNTFALSLVVFPTMLALSMVLGLASIRTVLWAAAIATVIDLILITYYVISSFL